MTFEDGYRALEQKFELQVKKDNACFGQNSVYLPNMRPEGPVDFVFVGMEPSCNWASSVKEACEKVDKGFKNFAQTIEDFIFHHCIRNYLCEEGRTYYITDLSKGAMSVEDAKHGRTERYKRWLPLLERELELVAKEVSTSERRTQIIAVGKTNVGKFLSKRELPSSVNYAGYILHYSNAANGHKGTQKKCYPGQYAEFAPSVAFEDVRRTAEKVMCEGEMEPFAGCTLERLDEKPYLTDIMKTLIFDYKVWFEGLREGGSLPS